MITHKEIDQSTKCKIAEKDC